MEAVTLGSWGKAFDESTYNGYSIPSSNISSRSQSSVVKVEWQVPEATSVYKFKSAVRGRHIYNSVWTPFTDETVQGDTNKYEYVVATGTDPGEVDGVANHPPWVYSFKLFHQSVSRFNTSRNIIFSNFPGACPQTPSKNMVSVVCMLAMQARPTLYQPLPQFKFCY